MITAQNLTKIFEGVRALDDVTFEIKEGCVLGLVGSNGSGKSTLLRLISGVYKADGGNICIDEIPVFDNPSLKTKIAFLGDTPYFPVHSNLTDMAKFYSGLYSDFSYDKFEKLIKIFPLDKKVRISSMSKGMQRQAALILMLSTNPKYILLDEAFDGLDVVMRRVLANIINEEVESNSLTAIIASHNLRELEDLCDHIALLHKGKLLFNNTTDSLRSQLHKVQIIFNHNPDKSTLASLDVVKCEQTGSMLQMIIRGEKGKIEEFLNNLCPVFCEFIEPTLEEMFVYELEVTGYDVKNILQ